MTSFVPLVGLIARPAAVAPGGVRAAADAPTLIVAGGVGLLLGAAAYRIATNGGSIELGDLKVRC